MGEGIRLTGDMCENIIALNNQRRLHKGDTIYRIPLKEMRIMPYKLIDGKTPLSPLRFRDCISVNPRVKPIPVAGDLRSTIASGFVDDYNSVDLQREFLRRAKGSSHAVRWFDDIPASIGTALRCLTPIACPRMPTQNIEKYLVPVYQDLSVPHGCPVISINVEPTDDTFQHIESLCNWICKVGLKVPNLDNTPRKDRRELIKRHYRKFYRLWDGYGSVVIFCTDREIAKRWAMWSLEKLSPYYVQYVDHYCRAQFRGCDELLAELMGPWTYDLFDSKYHEKNMKTLYDFISGPPLRLT